ncbi:MAG: RHS repeat-associated core domain-containing protein, partial [Sulfuritalea sp.]|nr:RHS repeat-associated core domain-containing protein [Sulfuritalea sp.]
LGNLTSRSSANLIENFYYDNINRLDSSTLNSSGVPGTTKTYTYDALGNLKSRSDVSVAGDSGYGYPASGTNSVRPHAVSRVNLIGAGNKYREYQYDANGNLANVAQKIPQSPPEQDLLDLGYGRTVTWTSFNMPSVIYDDAETDVQLEFTQYGPEHQRVTALLTKTENNVALTRSTVYLNPDSSGGLLFEKETKFDGAVEARHFLTAGGQVVAQVIRTTRTVNGALETTWATRYLHRDHLGSVTAVTDAAGNVIETMAYEPFGKRRVAAGQSTEGADDPGNTLRPVTTVRGFTNHEHVDELGIVHMNGRIYDPAIGRFLSADSILPAPYDLQSYNRYSYVHNNPLVYTDPDGHCEFFCVMLWIVGTAEVAHQLDIIDTSTTRMIQGMAIGAALAPVSGGLSFAGGGFTQATIAGFASGFVGSNFSIEGGVIGGLTAGAFNLVGTNLTGTFENILGHAAVGCASSSLSGGDCGSGALSAGFGAAATHFMPESFKQNPALKAAYVTIVGGTASVVGGGKFANGAQTAAFGYLFSHLAFHADANLSTNEATLQEPDTSPEPMQLAANTTAPGCGTGPMPCFDGGGGGGSIGFGSSGGPGAGKVFSRPVQDSIRARDGNACVYCGIDTIRSSTPAPNRSNIDHIVPKSQGGNNTPANGANACQTCNLKKAAKPLNEFLKNR